MLRRLIIHYTLERQAGSSTMLDYLFYLTDLPQSPESDVAFIKKNLYYFVLPYYRESYERTSVAQQIGAKNLFSFAVVRHPFER